MIKSHRLPVAAKKAIEIVEQLQRLGFPNKKNINEMEGLVQKLHELSPDLIHVHQLSVQQIYHNIQKIKAVLKTEKEIPVFMYSTLYAQLFVLDTNLHTDF